MSTPSLTALILLLSSALAVPAQTPKPDPALAPLSFLSGSWTSPTEEEYWSRPMGSSIVGTFRVLKEGQPVFYEFWAIEVEDGTPVYKLKHYAANLKGWEEKDGFVRLPMTEHAANSVTFSDGKVTLRYQRSGQTLVARLTHTRKGKQETEEFRLHLSPL